MRKNRENWKKITEKTEPIKILKKQAGSVRFRFYKPKTEKTEPNRTQTEKTESNRKKPSQTKPNRFEPVFALKNRTETGRFELVLVWFWFFFKKKNSVWLFFYL